MNPPARSAFRTFFEPARAGLTALRSLSWHLGAGDERRAGIRFLFYHRVTDDRDDLAVAPRRFHEQMAILAEQGYRVVDVATAGAMLARGECPARILALSFDDGYLDVAQNALPILDRYGFRATVFVVTGAVDGLVRFDWYARQPPLLSWEDIVALDGRSPLSFEAHSVTHPNLSALPDDLARAEVVESKAVLEDRLGRRVTAFCYPGGLFRSRDRALVAAAGYAVAVSCEPGVNVPSSDRFALRRIQIFPQDRPLDFRAKVAGAHDSPPLLRAFYRRLRYGLSADA